MRVTRRGLLKAGGASLVAAAAPRLAWGSTAADVIILGAGLAGLHAGAMLEQAGLRVMLLEARDRVGGRLHTLDAVPGRPNAGGVQVGSGYRRFNTIAERLGIRLLPAMAPPPGRSAAYLIGGRIVEPGEWSDATENRLAAAERTIRPDALDRHYLGLMPQLGGIREWMKPAATAHDVTLAEAMRRRGASDEALRLAALHLNASGIDSVSALHFLRQMTVYRAGAGPISTVEGGSQRLPEAMAAALAGPARLGAQAIGIREEADGVDLLLAGGERLRTRQLLCTIPFGALRGCAIEAPLPIPLAQLIAALPYVRISQHHFLASPAAIAELPQILWSDEPDLGRVFKTGETKEGVQLKLWYNGGFADRMDRLGAGRGARRAADRLTALCPGLASGNLVHGGFTSWATDPFARGAYHSFGAGQAALLAQTLRWRGARLHFAGEHLAVSATGMEGALESAERAVSDVLSRA